MRLLRKFVTRRVVLGLSTLLLVILLAACGGTGGNASSTPTTQAAAPTYPTTPVVTLKTYTGNGYTIGYPDNWKEQNTNGSIAFTDSLGLDTLTITVVPNPESVKSPSELVDTTLTLLEQTAGVKDAQPAPNVPTSATVGGETWAQKGVTGAVHNVPGELVVLADNHPASSPTTQAYEITYDGPQATFEATNSIFQAMLQSFKFTS